MNSWQRICIGRRKTYAVPGGMLKRIPKTMCTHDVSCSVVHVTSADTGTNRRAALLFLLRKSRNASCPAAEKPGPLYRCV